MGGYAPPPADPYGGDAGGSGTPAATAAEAAAVAGAAAGFRGNYGGESGIAAQDYTRLQYEQAVQAQQQAQQRQAQQEQYATAQRQEQSGAAMSSRDRQLREQDVVSTPLPGSDRLVGGKFAVTSIGTKASDINAPLIGESYAGTVKANDWVERLPVGIGDILNLVGLAKPIEERFPVDSFQETPGKWSLGNIPHSLASPIILTSETKEIPASDLPKYGSENNENAMRANTFIDTQTNRPTPIMTFPDRVRTPAEQAQVTKYTNDVGTYEKDVGTYNTLKTQYEKAGSNDPGTYAVLNNQYESLKAREQSLNVQKSNVEKIAPETFITVDLSKQKAFVTSTKGEQFKSSLGMAKAEFVEMTYGKVLPKYQATNPEGLPRSSQAVIRSGNIAGGAYNEMRDNPDVLAGNLALGAAVGVAFKAGEGILATGISKMAMAKTPALSAAGRLASTPTAQGIGTVAKVGLGGAFVVDTGEKIVNAPSDTARGAILINTGAQVAGFGIGASAVNMKPPENPYAGREFFSGKPAMNPVEKGIFAVETTARSLTTSSPSGYRDVATIMKPGRFVEPQVKAEPNFAELKSAGPYAGEIKQTIVEQPHSVIGSSTVRTQYSPEIVESAKLRVGNDVDVLLESPSTATANLAKRTGLSLEESKGVMDVHPIPKNYPLKASVEVDEAVAESSLLTRAIGDPYRNIGTPRSTTELIKGGTDYKGEITYEGAQVQFGRKAAAVSAFIEDPITKGYRSQKDVYDFISEYNAQKLVALSRGEPASNFVKSDAAVKDLMSKEITRGTVKGQRIGDTNPVVTQKIGDMYTAMEKKGAYETAAAGPEPRTPIRGTVVKAVSPLSASPALGSPALFGTPIQSPKNPQDESLRTMSISRSATRSPRLSVSPSESSGLFSISPSAGPSRIKTPKGSSPGSDSGSPKMMALASANQLSTPSSVLPLSLFRSSPGISKITGSPSSLFPSSSPSPYPISPYSAISTTTYTPPVPPTVPPTGIPFLPGSGGSQPGTKKRHSHFVEMFRVGLDYSIKKRSKAAGKSFTSPKPRSKKKGVKK